MRKTLAIVLSIVMVLSLAVVGVSAADATEITTAEAFAAMAADGNYKLGADITLTATYGAGETVTAFTGTLDGQGHTVTVSAAIFEKLSGTVKNLTIAGTVTDATTTKQIGALANLGADTIVVENVTNNAAVNTAYRAGGLIGQINKGATATFTNCVNNGKITHTGTAAAMVGGIIGYIQGNTLTVTDCVNNGAVSNEAGLAGGIVGRTGGDYATGATNIMTIKNCLNTADISGATNIAGIVGFARGCALTIENCTNKGNITSVSSDAAGIISSSNVTTVDTVKNVGNCNINILYCLNEGNCTTAKGRAAGIMGYCWCGTGAESVSNHVEAIGNVNKGTMKGTTNVGQIVTYTNSAANIIKDNVGLGKVEAGAESALLCFYGFSSAALPEGMTGNKIVSDGSVYYTYTATSGKEANIIKIQDLTADHGLAVVSEADALAAVAALGNVGYQAPSAPATGDSMIWVAVVALVSILGMGISVKARNN